MNRHVKTILYGVVASVAAMAVWSVIEAPVKSALGVAPEPHGPEQEKKYWFSRLSSALN